MDISNFSCPECGNEGIKVIPEPCVDYEAGTPVCVACGHHLTRDEIIDQVRKFALKNLPKFGR